MASNDMDLASKLADTYFECSICANDYDNPKQLPCSHTFCQLCIEKWIGARKKNKTKNKFECPICKKSTSIPQGGVTGFPNNYVINNLMEDVRKFEENSVYLPKSENEVTSSPSTPMCSKHSNEPVTLYCETCTQLVCEECFGKHNTHDLKSFKKAKGEVKDMMRHKMAAVEGKVEDFSKMSKSLRDNRDHLEEELVTGVSHVQKIMELVNMIGQKKLNQMGDSFSRANAHYSQFESDLIGELHACETTLDQGRNLQDNSDAVFMKRSAGMMAKLDQHLDEKVDRVWSKAEQLTLEEFDEKAFVSQMEAMFDKAVKVNHSKMSVNFPEFEKWLTPDDDTEFHSIDRNVPDLALPKELHLKCMGVLNPGLEGCQAMALTNEGNIVVTNTRNILCLNLSGTVHWISPLAVKCLAGTGDKIVGASKGMDYMYNLDPTTGKPRLELDPVVQPGYKGSYLEDLCGNEEGDLYAICTGEVVKCDAEQSKFVSCVKENNLLRIFACLMRDVFTGKQTATFNPKLICTSPDGGFVVLYAVGFRMIKHDYQGNVQWVWTLTNKIKLHEFYDFMERPCFTTILPSGKSIPFYYRPCALTCDSEGNVFMADCRDECELHVIHRLSPSGEYLNCLQIGRSKHQHIVEMDWLEDRLICLCSDTSRNEDVKKRKGQIVIYSISKT